MAILLKHNFAHIWCTFVIAIFGDLDNPTGEQDGNACISEPSQNNTHATEARIDNACTSETLPGKGDIQTETPAKEKPSPTVQPIPPLRPHYSSKVVTDKARDEATNLFTGHKTQKKLRLYTQCFRNVVRANVPMGEWGSNLLFYENGGSFYETNPGSKHNYPEVNKFLEILKCPRI